MNRELRWRALFFGFLFVLVASFFSDSFRGFITETLWDFCAWTQLGWCSIR